MATNKLYAEATGTIDCTGHSRITLTHGIGETPDDVGIACTDQDAADPATFQLISKNATEVIWQVAGTRMIALNFRCWARRNHSIIDSRSTAAVTVTGLGAAPRQVGSHVQILHDFGTRPVVVSA